MIDKQALIPAIVIHCDRCPYYDYDEIAVNEEISKTIAASYFVLCGWKTKEIDGKRMTLCPKCVEDFEEK